MTRNALMVDLETLATTPDAAILTLGACMFDPFGGMEQEIPEHEVFLAKASIQSNEDAGRRIQAGTLEWWLKQNDTALKALVSGNITNLRQLLVKFRLWVDSETDCRPKTIWANSPSFDMVILRNAYDQAGEGFTYGFWMERDVRTIGEIAYPHHQERKAVMKTIRDNTGTHHRADDDAIAQARFVAHCYEKLGIEP